MRAIICIKYGPPEVLQLKEVEKPTPKNNEVRIKIFATTVTSGDIRLRSFNVPLSFWLPARIALGLRKPKKAILGSESASDCETKKDHIGFELISDSERKWFQGQGKVSNPIN
jgi:NADPH:quinone reductase-like Zn-dependent oxidoreductase